MGSHDAEYRVDNTVRLFQPFIDTQNNVTSLFRYLETAYTKEPSLSDSTHLTQQVVQRIQTDDTFRAAAAYYLRYEQQLHELKFSGRVLLRSLRVPIPRP